MSKVCAAIIGYGNRGEKYSDYAINHPDQLEIVAVCDNNKVKLELAKERFSLSDDRLFSNLESFLDAKIDCEVIINTTMDQHHYATAIPILKAGYNLLLEKPITANVEELLEIDKTAKKMNAKVLVCHVLRYTPFYSEIKRIIDSGEIGKIIDMQLNEHVWYGHFVDAYVRGKWRSEKECGSGLILAKCCHDTDLMCWFNNTTTPLLVSSFGSRNCFSEKNAPETSTDYCYDCPEKATCTFDAVKMHVENKTIDDYAWAEINKPIHTITTEEKIEYLKRGSFGKCVYKTGMDIVDRQCVSVEFENGSIGTLTVTTGGAKAGRHIHVVCEMGEIVGYVEENKFIIRKYNKDKKGFDETLIDFNEINKLQGGNQSESGHYGGDVRLMSDLCNFINGEKTTVSTTVIEDSINGHLVCYAAEEARKWRTIVDIKKYKNQFCSLK